MEEGDNLFKSDHEFSCESDVPDEDWQPVKHARTATKVTFKIAMKQLFKNKYFKLGISGGKRAVDFRGKHKMYNLELNCNFETISLNRKRGRRRLKSFLLRRKMTTLPVKSVQHLTIPNGSYYAINAMMDGMHLALGHH